MDKNNMDVIRLNPFHITNIKDLKINSENVTSISENTNNILYVSKDGNDETGNGSFGNPFLTINYANNYFIDNKPTYPARGVINVAPGIYEEQIEKAFYRIYIVGDLKQPDEKDKAVTIYNTGIDEDHYPLGTTISDTLNLIGINVKCDSGGIFGVMKTCNFSYCKFIDGHFIENTDDGYYSVFTFCIGDNLFNLQGITNGSSRNIKLSHCDIYGGTIIMNSSGTDTHTLKINNSAIGSIIDISGDWALNMMWSEMYTESSKLTFDTNGYVDIFATILVNGVHFYSDTPETKKLVNCIFKQTPTGEGDITADESIEFIEYSGNHQHNGINGEVITVSKIKNVAGGQNKYRNIHEALKGSTLQDTIINLEGDIEIDIPLVIPPNVDIQIDGNNKWLLNSTATVNIVELSENQHLSFVGIRKITGGKKAIINGNSASLAFIDCGNYLNPCNVNIELNSGNISSSAHVLNSVIIGVSAPAITINDINTWLIIDKSFIKGSSGEPAIEWSVDADSRFRGKYSTLLHGSGVGNSPFVNTTTTPTEDINFSLYNSSLNASYPANEFTNLISAQPNISVDPDIDY